MTDKNFSPGDVVVCVDAAGCPMLAERSLYTVLDAYLGTLVMAYGGESGPCVRVAGVIWPGREGGFASIRFKLAFTPDPEVERERAEEPIKHKEPTQ